MSFTEWPIPGPYRNASGGPVDPYYFLRVSETTYRPYNSLAEAAASVPVADRDGRVVNILGVDNWWLPGATADDELLIKSVRDSFAVLPYSSSSIAVNFNSETVRTVNATGNLVYGPSVNVSLLSTVEHYIINSRATDITLRFPAEWSFFPGPAPTILAAGAEAELHLRSLGTSDNTVKARFIVGVAGITSSTITYTALPQTYITTTQDFAAKCPNSPTGAPIQRTSSDGTSTTSQYSANLMAMADAKAQAIGAIICTVAGPTVISATFTGDGVLAPTVTAPTFNAA